MEERRESTGILNVSEHHGEVKAQGTLPNRKEVEEPGLQSELTSS
jgi:hypothetical protein